METKPDTAITLDESTLCIEIEIKKRNVVDLYLKRRSRVFKVKKTRLSTLIYFSQLTEKLRDDKSTSGWRISDLIDSIMEDKNLAIKLIAIFIEDTDRNPNISLQRFLKTSLDVTEIKGLLLKLVKYSQLEHFFGTVLLVRKSDKEEPAWGEEYFKKAQFSVPDTSI